MGAAEAAEQSIVQVAAVAAVDIMGDRTQEALEVRAKAEPLTFRCARAEQVPFLMEP